MNGSNVAQPIPLAVKMLRHVLNGCSGEAAAQRFGTQPRAESGSSLRVQDKPAPNT